MSLASVRVDKKGRLIIPKALREEMGVKEGDTFFVQRVGPSVLQFARVENPFDVLAREAFKERRDGTAITLEQWAERENVSLEDE